MFLAVKRTATFDGSQKVDYWTGRYYSQLMSNAKPFQTRYALEKEQYNDKEGKPTEVWQIDITPFE